MDNKQEERRRFPRFNLLVDVAFKKKTSILREKLSVTKNISKGGVCIISYEPLREGDIIDLKVFIPDHPKALEINGKVVWSKEFVIGDPQKGTRYDVGVEFIDADDNTLNIINKYLFRH